MKKKKIWLMIITIVLVLLVVLVMHVYRLFDDAFSRVTDPAKYEHVRKMLSTNTQFNYFPAHIPATANTVVFYYQPGYGMGGPIMCLRYTLPVKEIDKMLQQNNKEKVYTVKSDEIKYYFDDWRCYPPVNLRQVKEYNQMCPNFQPLPSDFNIYIRNTDLKHVPENGTDNFFGFVAIARKRNQVCSAED